MENHASRTRSPVGRTASPDGVLRRRPLKSPAMMRIMPGPSPPSQLRIADWRLRIGNGRSRAQSARSEEHTSELQSHSDLVCRLLLEKKNKIKKTAKSKKQ